MSDLHKDLKNLRASMVSLLEKHETEITNTHAMLGGSGTWVKIHLMDELKGAVEALDDAIDTYENANDIGEYAPPEPAELSDFDEHGLTMRSQGVKTGRTL